MIRFECSSLPATMIELDESMDEGFTEKPLLEVRRVARNHRVVRVQVVLEPGVGYAAVMLHMEGDPNPVIIGCRETSDPQAEESPT